MGIITVSCLGRFGRFGNSLFQYAFARAYAESIGAELVIPPDWVGIELFEGVKERLDDMVFNERTESPDGRANIDLYGYFQRPEHLKLLSRSKLKRWFKPKLSTIVDKMPLVFHKRRGDYIQAGNYALVSDKSYDDAARKFGFDPEDATAFSDDRPVEKQYEDFFALVNSEVLFRANSSYSWWAATLSDGRVFSPVVGDRTGWIDCEFVEGNHPKMVSIFEDLHIGE